jgi:hypothetical protein
MQMQQQQRLNGDDNIIAYFKQCPVLNPSKTAAAGRPIYDDCEAVIMQAAGSRLTVSPQPATARSHWVTDPLTGEQTPVTYAERFARQYQQFKRQETQTMSGTPLDHARFLTEARRAELRALNVFTIEQLAALDGAELKNIGPQGRELKNMAEAFIADALKGAPNAQLVAELDAVRALNQTLQDDVNTLKAAKAAAEDKNADTRFDNMSTDQLKDFITSRSGHVPQGQLPRKTLERMAAEIAA